jgi:hypothetical protein
MLENSFTPQPTPLFAFWAGHLAALLPEEMSAERAQFGEPVYVPDTAVGLNAWLRQATGRDLLVPALQRVLDLDLAECLTLVLLQQVERDPQLAPLLAVLQHPYGGMRPCLGLIQRVLGRCLGEDDGLIGRLRHGPLSRSGVLLWEENPELPLVQQAPRLHPDLVACDMHPQGLWPDTRLLPSLPLSPSLHRAVDFQVDALRGRDRVSLVLRCIDREEGKAAAAAIAHGLMRRPLWVANNGIESALGVWCELSDYLPVLGAEPAPGETHTLPGLSGYKGPLLVIAGADGRFEREGAVIESWRLPRTPEEERRALWKEQLPELDAEELGQRYRVGAQRIQQLADRAKRRAHLENRRVRPGDLRQIAWGDNQVLAGLAQPVVGEVPDEALVLRPGTRDDLDNLVQRCRRREALACGLGITLQSRYRSGVRALFVGPSGTGKTLACAWLATRLGLPLYRVDSAAVSSKYIGETEKNLARLLAEAEAQSVVLLFDEADALFGKRTDIKDSNDRFANAQTNYLLQRIEQYDGIVVLTSNSRQRLDAAFTRRLDLILEFPAPGPEERRDLWLSHLGQGHSLQQRQLNLLAGACDISGGQIRNIVLDAAVRVGKGPIGILPLCQAVAAEYRKQGKPIPSEVRQQLARAP